MYTSQVCRLSSGTDQTCPIRRLNLCAKMNIVQQVMNDALSHFVLIFIQFYGFHLVSVAFLGLSTVFSPAAFTTKCVLFFLGGGGGVRGTSLNIFFSV